MSSQKDDKDKTMVAVFGDNQQENIEFVYSKLDKIKSIFPPNSFSLVVDFASSAALSAGSWGLTNGYKVHPGLFKKRSNNIDNSVVTLSELENAVEFIGTKENKVSKIWASKLNVVRIPLTDEEKESRNNEASYFKSLDPKLDGKDYINVYSKANTKLGLLLSNFTPIHEGHLIETADGDFKSVEGYWYFLRTQGLVDREKLYLRENLKLLWGYDAKKLGKELLEVTPLMIVDTVDFRLRIKDAIISKINSSELLQDLFFSNNKPYTHFYLFGNPPTVIRGEGQWIIKFLNELGNIR